MTRKTSSTKSRICLSLEELPYRLCIVLLKCRFLSRIIIIGITSASIHPPIHPWSIRPSMNHSPTRLPIHPSTYNPSVRPFLIHPLILAHPSIHTSIHSCIYSFIHTFIYSFIHSCMHDCMLSCIHPVVYDSFIHTSIHSFIHSFIHAFVHKSFGCSCIPMSYYGFILIIWRRICSQHEALLQWKIYATFPQRFLCAFLQREKEIPP